MKDFENSPFICFEDESGAKHIDILPEHNEWNDTGDIANKNLISILKEFFKIEMDPNPKMLHVSEGVLKFLENKLRTFPSLETFSQLQYLVLTEIFRSLRNSSSNVFSQNYIVKETCILNCCKELFQNLHMNQDCLKIMLQFLTNLTTSNKKATLRLHTFFYDDLKICFRKHLCLYQCSALLYNMSLFISMDDQETLEKILDLYGSEEHNEFLCYFLENHISNSRLWTSYINLSLESRLKILDIVKEMQIQDNLKDLPDSALEILIKKFLECGEIILQINERNSLEVYEISSSLEILSSLSSKEEYLKKLQTRKDILVNAGALLLNIHKLGKVSDTTFSPVQKLSENGNDGRGFNTEPIFGFKADLVRLIGNICWKHFELQNLARTAEIIPVILDSCNIDAKNPFIMQWCILAIRNLCENNIENQKVIAGLHQEGSVSSEVLDEMGITLHTDGENQLKIINLESLRK